MHMCFRMAAFYYTSVIFVLHENIVSPSQYDSDRVKTMS